MKRQYTQEEIQAFNNAEQELAALGLIVTDRLTTEVIVGWFDQHPEVAATKEAIVNFVQHPLVKPKLRWKSEAQMKFEKSAANMAPQDLETLEKFLRANRLWPSDDEAYLNARQFINYMGGRPYTVDVLAHLALPQFQGSSRQPLYWKTPGQASTYRNVGQHSGDSHFAPRAESNVGSGFVGRIDHAKHPSTEIPRPAPASKTMDDFQWTRLASALCGDRHSDTDAIQRRIQVVLDQGGTAEQAYREGVRVKNQLRVERERGR